MRTYLETPMGVRGVARPSASGLRRAVGRFRVRHPVGQHIEKLMRTAQQRQLHPRQMLNSNCRCAQKFSQFSCARRAFTPGFSRSRDYCRRTWIPRKRLQQLPQTHLLPTTSLGPGGIARQQSGLTRPQTVLQFAHQGQTGLDNNEAIVTVSVRHFFIRLDSAGSKAGEVHLLILMQPDSTPDDPKERPRPRADPERNFRIPRLGAMPAPWLAAPREAAKPVRSGL